MLRILPLFLVLLTACGGASKTGGAGSDDAKKLVQKGRSVLMNGGTIGEANEYFSKADKLSPGISPSSEERKRLFEEGMKAKGMQLQNEANQRPAPPARRGE